MADVHSKEKKLKIPACTIGNIFNKKVNIIHFFVNNITIFAKHFTYGYYIQ